MDDFTTEDIAPGDAIAVGEKVIEMAERVRRAHAAIPGARATWNFDMEEARFLVVVTVVDQVKA